MHHPRPSVFNAQLDGDWVRGLIFAAVTIVALVAISWVLCAIVENARLRKAVFDLTLDKLIPQEAAKVNTYTGEDGSERD